MMHFTTKVTIAIIILTIAIIGSGGYVIQIISRTSYELEKQVIQVEYNTQKRNWKAAEINLNEFKKTWDSTHKTWTILLDHLEIDIINNSFSRTSRYIQAKDYALALGEEEALRQAIKHIRQKEYLSLINIF